MDWVTYSTSVGSALVGGGLIGGLVSLRVARKESDDRQDALALEREKWEHQRTAASREQMRESALKLSDYLAELAVAVHEAWGTYRAHNNAPSEAWKEQTVMTLTAHLARHEVLDHNRWDLPPALRVLVGEVFLAGLYCIKATCSDVDSDWKKRERPDRSGTVDELFDRYTRANSEARAELRMLLQNL